MTISRLFHSSLLVCLFVALISVVQLAIPISAFAYDLLLGTGKTGTFSYFAGKRICHSINSAHSEVTCRPIPMQNYAASLTNLEGGALDLALVNGKMISDAANNRGLFRYLDIDYSSLRLLMPLYREPVSLIVRQDARITKLDDLPGKRINGGPVFTMPNIIFNEIMKVKGWNVNDFGLYQTLSPLHAQDSIAFNSGDIQVMIHVGMHPDKELQQELINRKGILIGVYDEAVESLIKADSGFVRDTIDTSLYSKASDESQRNLPTLALETLLITSVDTDTETVDIVLGAIFSGKYRLHEAHPGLAVDTITREMLTTSHLPPHPVAMQFFQGRIDDF
ncbi:MAG: TAXI family TRAP transporter solute-binding subunit [Desulfocapsaceae bacterium]|nr:TAXI family TRAP transporter solute-binding subunit [Desulfocapsaceae bacterium]